MKAFYRATVGLGLIAILFLTIGSAAAADVTSAREIRGPLYDERYLTDLLRPNGYYANLPIDATQFAPFYYDIDNDVIRTT